MEENPPDKNKFEVEIEGTEIRFRDLQGLGERAKGERCKRVVAPDIVYSNLENREESFCNLQLYCFISVLTKKKKEFYQSRLEKFGCLC